MNAPMRIVAMTYRQVLPTRRVLGLVALSALPAIIVYFTARTATLEVLAGLIFGLFFNVVIPVIAIVTSTSALGDERRDKTLGFIVLRPVSRYVVAASKLAGGAGTAGVIAAIGAVTLGVALGLRGWGWDYVAPLLVGAVLSALVYGAVFTPLGYLTERATLGGFAYVFLWENAIAGSVPGLAATSLWRIGFGATAAMAPPAFLAELPPFALGSIQPGVGGAVVKTLVACAVSVAITAWLLRTRDHV